MKILKGIGKFLLGLLVVCSVPLWGPLLFIGLILSVIYTAGEDIYRIGEAWIQTIRELRAAEKNAIIEGGK